MSDSNPVEIDTQINTDDLDAFTDLFNGKTKVEPEKAPAEDTGEPADEVPEEVETPEEDAPEENPPEDAEAKEDDDEDIFRPTKKPRTAKERIDELTRLRYEAERREAEALRRLSELERERTPKNEPPSRPVVESGAPSPDSTKDGQLVYPLGEFDPAYIRDLTRFYASKEAEAANAQRAEQEQARQNQAAAQKLQSDWDAKLTTVEKELPDLRPTLQGLESELSGLDPDFGTYLAQTIMGMDDGPKVLYYLANNVDEAQKIIAAGPVNATIALGKLEDKIQRAQAKKAVAPVRASSAPVPPVTTRGTGSRSVVADDTDDLDAFNGYYYC
jgi:chemotaxis protein histidine kinase CheA